MGDQDSPDYHSFTQASSPTHRLPTLNGAQALFDAAAKHKPISTGLGTLDTTLSSVDPRSHDGKGISRGRVTEIYGPPGSGKTHLAIQLAVHVLKDNSEEKVTWVDTASELPFKRLDQFLNTADQGKNYNGGAIEADQSWDHRVCSCADDRFTYHYVSSFPHLLAVLLSPSDEFLPEDTALLVLDDFSNVVLSGLPQNERIGGAPSSSSGPLSRDDIISKSIATRRAAMISAVSSGLSRLAAARNIAVVVLNKTSSYRKLGGKNSVLRSALNVQQWNESVATRIVIYRDFWPAVDWSSLSSDERYKWRQREKFPLRVAAVEKLAGREVRVDGVRFAILNNHLQQVEAFRSLATTNVALRSSSQPLSDDNGEAMGNLGLDDAEEGIDQSVRMPEDVISSSAAPQKRKIEEVADSEEEDDLDIARQVAPVSRSGLNQHHGFMPSSQLAQDGGDEASLPLQAYQSHTSYKTGNELGDDILLRE